MSKLITIFGATGNQGGSLANYILSRPELSQQFKVRGVTRDSSKPAAQKLKDAGAEVVAADLSKPETLAEAVKGSWAVFGVTNFWEHLDGQLEERQGKAIADAAVAAGAQLLIWSSLPHASTVTNGHLVNIKHFDHKANVEAYARTLPIQSAFFWPAGFFTALNGDFGPRKNEQGSYSMTNIWAPDSKVPFIDITDTGKFIAPILKNPAAWNHQRMYAASGFYTPEQLVAAIGKATGKEVGYVQIPDEVMKGFLPPPIATELYENVVLMREYKYFGGEGKGAEAELERSLAALDDKPTTLEEFIKKSEWPGLA